MKLVAELEALWSQLAGKAADLSEKVDRVLRQTEQYSTKTLEEEFDSIHVILEEP